jgi:hypothetical protein
VVIISGANSRRQPKQDFRTDVNCVFVDFETARQFLNPGQLLIAWKTLLRETHGISRVRRMDCDSRGKRLEECCPVADLCIGGHRRPHFCASVTGHAPAFRQIKCRSHGVLTKRELRMLRAIGMLLTLHAQADRRHTAKSMLLIHTDNVEDAGVYYANKAVM